MSLGWVIAGTIGQSMLAMMMFMFAVFAGGGMANGNNLSPLQIRILDLSMIALPASCVVSAGVVIYLYNTGGSASSYGWYVLPLVVAALYYVFISNMTR